MYKVSAIEGVGVLLAGTTEAATKGEVNTAAGALLLPTVLMLLDGVNTLALLMLVLPLATVEALRVESWLTTGES